MRFLNVFSLQIDELPPIIREDVKDFLERHPRSPTAQLLPKLGVVCSVWLAYIGPKLQRGASGLGQTPCDALEDFNLRFMERSFPETVPSRNRPSRSRFK